MEENTNNEEILSLELPYMVRAMNEMRENVNSFIREGLDEERAGVEFNTDAKKQTLEEALKELDTTCSYFKQEYLAGEKIEPTTIMDIVIAAAIAFKKLD